MYGKSFAGRIEETEGGFRFAYDADFLKAGNPISRSLPLREKPYESKELFPFFQGLLPEGWYKEIVCRTLKIDENDHFGLLIGTCQDCVGAVWIRGIA